MSVFTWQVLRAASSHSHPITCRYAAGRRLPHLKRTVHTSPSRRREDAPTNSPQIPGSWSLIVEPSLPNDSPVSEPQNGAPDDVPERLPRPKDPSYYGSAARRAGRNIKRVKEVPQVLIPPWFPDRNVSLREEVSDFGQGGEDDATNTSVHEGAPAEPPSRDPHTDLSHSAPSVSIEAAAKGQSHDGSTRSRLKINMHVREEVLSLIRAGLRVPEIQYAESVAALKPHMVLSCPKSGGSAHLEAFVSDIAKQTDTDIMRLSCQDIAEIGGDYMEDPSAFRSNTLSSLGYDIAQIAHAARAQPPPSQNTEQDEYEESEESLGEHPQPTHGQTQLPQGVFGGANISVMPAFVGAFRVEDIFKNLKLPKDAMMEDPGQSPKAPNGKAVLQLRDNSPEMKLGMLVETLLNVPELKRVMRQHTQDISSSNPEASSSTSPESQKQIYQAERGSNGLIVLVEDYPLINMTMNGGKFLDKLHEVVEARRKDGQPILIVGTASHKDVALTPGDHKSAVDNTQSYPWNGPVRTVVVPIKGTSNDSSLNSERKRKIANTNLRHLRDMLRRIAPVQEQVGPVIYDWDLSIESKWAFIAALDQSIWSLDKVNRIATVALGLVPRSEAMSAKTIESALEIIDASDDSKYGWYKKHFEKELRLVDKLKSTFSANDEANEGWMNQLRKKCNKYEKKLLNGVVDSKGIRTTFADVQAPAETVQALKTLTSLSLVRPDAFTYGVLATDRIPGLLLYGPPGTGKTLLAKAVAKESEATVLEVSGSDVYDMYVGEGEKNIKAIFSLAKKLSPCIVFIDEADAILGSRDGGHSRTSHRDLINQFLREWDGMTETTAFIMVATNRPFDLDEASLRRLPRRLLIDLPTEADREAILKIHLKDETLDSEVSISKLASQTPYYSGSDLKNLSVAAALACVREEFDAAISHNKDSPDQSYQYAEKRTLQQRHFTTATEEISASISEDMGSLSAIRKFDEKYGDRRGRRKKLGGYGFKTAEDSEKLGSDAARVRNQT